jgi:uncharacterized protein YbaR (Trm112 family)
MSRVKTIPGQARTCPLCKATILESASICPACRHHLRFDARSTQRTWTSFFPLRVEGTIRQPEGGEPWEYSIVLAIHDDKGEEIARQVVGVGALKPAERRTFTLAVEVLTPVEVASAEAAEAAEAAETQ